MGSSIEELKRSKYESRAAKQAAIASDGFGGVPPAWHQD